MSFIGDIGGVVDVLIFVLGIIINPVQYLNFILKALEKLFLAKTKDNKMFNQIPKIKQNGKHKFSTAKKQVPDHLRGTIVEENVMMHYPIKLNKVQVFKLFMLNVFSKC